MARGKDLSARRSALYHAASDSFRLHGFQRTTVEDVCRQAGVSKASFYELFADKYQLLILLEQRRLADALAAWKHSSETLSASGLLSWYARWLDADTLLKAAHGVTQSPSPGYALRTARQPLAEELAKWLLQESDSAQVEWVLDAVEGRVLLHRDRPWISADDDFLRTVIHRLKSITLESEQD